MSGKLSDAWLEELRSRVSLEEVVSEYVPLKQKGRRFWGCCPFHNEKTPSFSVSRIKQMFYCFGCHKGGNVITFVEEYDHLSFTEAVEALVPEGWTTVGISLHVAHTAATPVGLTVRAEAEVTAVEGRKIIFTVRAYDDQGEIGVGSHERFAVAKEKFLAKAAAKVQH